MTIGEYTNGKKTGTWLFWIDKQVVEVTYQGNLIAKVSYLLIYTKAVANNYPPKVAFIRMAALLLKKNVTGTITNVRKVAKVSPNITVHARGPQKITFSPPKYI